MLKYLKPLAFLVLALTAACGNDSKDKKEAEPTRSETGTTQTVPVADPVPDASQNTQTQQPVQTQQQTAANPSNVPPTIDAQSYFGDTANGAGGNGIANDQARTAQPNGAMNGQGRGNPQANGQNRTQGLPPGATLWDRAQARFAGLRNGNVSYNKNAANKMMDAAYNNDQNGVDYWNNALPPYNPNTGYAQGMQQQQPGGMQQQQAPSRGRFPWSRQ